MGEDVFNSKLNTYLENCKNNHNAKCLIIATDQQCVICSEDDFEGSFGEEDSHNDLVSIMEMQIHPNDNTDGWGSYKLRDAYVFLEGPEVIANLPLDGNLSTNQAGFLIDAISGICKFNVANQNYASLDIISSSDCKSYNSSQFKSISKHILSLIKETYTTEEERIIGKTAITTASIEETIKAMQKTL